MIYTMYIYVYTVCISPIGYSLLHIVYSPFPIDGDMPLAAREAPRGGGAAIQGAIYTYICKYI